MLPASWVKNGIRCISGTSCLNSQEFMMILLGKNVIYFFIIVSKVIPLVANSIAVLWFLLLLSVFNGLYLH